jgi:signal transduction histidine kinase
LVWSLPQLHVPLIKHAIQLFTVTGTLVPVKSVGMDFSLNFVNSTVRPVDIPQKGLLEYSHFGYMWTTLHSKKIIASHTVYQLLELEPFAELLTLEKWRKFVQPQDLPLLLRAEEKLLITTEPVAVEYRLLTKNGRQIFVNHSMQLTTSDKGELKIVSILDDITESKRADTILEVMNESFFELTRDFVFRRINAKAESFWNVCRENVLGENMWNIFPQAVGSHLYLLLQKAVREKKDSIAEVLCPVTKHWLRLSVSFYTDGLIVIFYDIHQQKQAEADNRLLNATLTKKNHELASVNSELKTFSSIIGNNYLETMGHLYISLERIVTQDAQHLSNSGRANLRRAQSAIQNLKLITEDLVSFSRLQQIGDKEEQVDLNQILEDVIKDFESQPGHPVINMTCEHLPAIKGYPFLISLVFHHLVDNAIKFRKSNTEHRVAITCRQSVSRCKNGENQTVMCHEISFSDNGIGFPPEQANRIFDIFYRLHEKRDYKGSGIGLAICKKIMEMHEGFITAESNGEGSVFHCYFPV